VLELPFLKVAMSVPGRFGDYALNGDVKEMIDVSLVSGARGDAVDIEPNVQDVDVADKALCKLQRMVQNGRVVFGPVNIGKDMLDTRVPCGRYVGLRR